MNDAPVVETLDSCWLLPPPDPRDFTITNPELELDLFLRWLLVHPWPPRVPNLVTLD